MTEVVALQSFEHSGRRNRGDRLSLSENVARALAERKLVRIVEDSAPKQSAAGEPSFASPAAPASPLTTASLSDDGEPKRRRGRPRKNPEPLS